MKLFLVIGNLLGFLSLLLPAQDDVDLPLDIDSPEVTVDFRLGLGQYAFEDESTPVVVLLKNETDRVMSGEVLVEAVYFQRSKLRDRYREGSVDVELGQGAQQSVSFVLSGVRTGSFVISFRETGGAVRWQRYVYLEFLESRDLRLHLWSLTPETSVLEAGPPLRRTAVAQQGQRVLPQRKVRPLVEAKIPAWALPSNPRHLTLGNGVLLGHESLTRLTGAQEEALATYVTHGGVLLVPQDSPVFEKRLWARTDFEVSSLEGREAHVGLGRVLRYAPTALTQGNAVENTWIYEALDEAPRRTGLPLQPAYDDRRGRNLPKALGERTRASKRTCLWFVGLFMLMTGPALWFLRRLPRRRFLWALGMIVAIFCVVAVLLGVHLRSKPGELWWSSLTEIAPHGGALQTSVFEVESAGARSHRLAVSDPNALFFQPHSDYISFSAESKAGEVVVPLLPWSHRRVVSENELAGCQPIGCSLKIVGPKRLELNWENPNAFKIRSVELFLWSRVGRPADVFEPRVPRPRNGQRISLSGGLQARGIVIQGENRLPLLLDDYSRADSGVLLDGNSEESPRIGVTLYPNLMEVYTAIADPYAGMIIFEVDRSPGVTIEKEKTDFVSTAGMHYVVQTLSREDLPEYEKLFSQEPYKITPPPSNKRRRR